MSSRVDGAWAEGFVIKGRSGEFYGGNGWVGEEEAAVWRSEDAARDVALRLGLSAEDCKILPAKLANGRTAVE